MRFPWPLRLGIASVVLALAGCLLWGVFGGWYFVPWLLLSWVLPSAVAACLHRHKWPYRVVAVLVGVQLAVWSLSTALAWPATIVLFVAALLPSGAWSPE